MSDYEYDDFDDMDLDELESEYGEYDEDDEPALRRTAPVMSEEDRLLDEEIRRGYQTERDAWDKYVPFYLNPNQRVIYKGQTMSAREMLDMPGAPRHTRYTTAATYMAFVTFLAIAMFVISILNLSKRNFDLDANKNDTNAFAVSIGFLITALTFYLSRLFYFSRHVTVTYVMLGIVGAVGIVFVIMSNVVKGNEKLKSFFKLIMTASISSFVSMGLLAVVMRANVMDRSLIALSRARNVMDQEKRQAKRIKVAERQAKLGVMEAKAKAKTAGINLQRAGAERQAALAEAIAKRKSPTPRSSRSAPTRRSRSRDSLNIYDEDESSS